MFKTELYSSMSCLRSLVVRLRDSNGTCERQGGRALVHKNAAMGHTKHTKQTTASKARDFSTACFPPSVTEFRLPVHQFWILSSIHQGTCRRSLSLPLQLAPLLARLCPRDGVLQSVLRQPSDQPYSFGVYIPCLRDSRSHTYIICMHCTDLR
jgi:hypothetical protein